MHISFPYLECPFYISIDLISVLPIPIFFSPWWHFFLITFFSIHYLFFHLPIAFENLLCDSPRFLGRGNVRKDSNSHHWHHYPHMFYGTVPAATVKISLQSNVSLIFIICVLCLNSTPPIQPQLFPSKYEDILNLVKPILPPPTPFSNFSCLAPVPWPVFQSCLRC